MSRTRESTGRGYFLVLLKNRQGLSREVKNMSNSKAWVVYYSLSNKTKSVAESLAIAMDCPLKEIEETKKRKKDIITMIKGGYQAFMKKSSKIIDLKIPENITTLFIGTPVWAGDIAPGVRSFIKQNEFKDKNIVLFCTSASGKEKNTFSSMNSLLAERGGLVMHKIDLKSTGSAQEFQKRINDEIMRIPYNQL